MTSHRELLQSQIQPVPVTTLSPARWTEPSHLWIKINAASLAHCFCRAFYHREEKERMQKCRHFTNKETESLPVSRCPVFLHPLPPGLIHFPLTTRQLNSHSCSSRSSTSKANKPHPSDPVLLLGVEFCKLTFPGPNDSASWVAHKELKGTKLRSQGWLLLSKRAAK